jgi:hypothetical protein
MLAILAILLSLVVTDAVLGVVVIERRISASSDDAEEALNPGYTNWNYSSDLEIVDDNIDNGGSQLIGMTFRDIKIEPGEVISNAYIEFVCDEIIDGTDDAYFLIWGHLTENSEGFIEPYLISDRPKTEAKVPWEPDPWNAVGQKIQTVNIAPIIQELINQENWNAGNAIEIIIGADLSKPAFTGVRCAESFDGSRSNAPLLHIEVAVPYATEPDPADGIIYPDTWTNLSWSVGISAVSHDVYFSDSLVDVETGAESAYLGNQTEFYKIVGFPGFAHPDGLTHGTTYYWRVDEVEADGSTVTGDIWSFMVTPKTAYNPNPADGGMYIDPNVELSWTAGLGPNLHIVYFGDNFDDVNNAAGGPSQVDATYTPGTLEMDKTYYWRVDEFDDTETHKGDVWSFSTIPVFEITDPNLIGWWKFDETGGDIAVDFSGYGNDGELRGAPVRVEGILGGALDLMGDDYVVIDGVVDDITSTDITLSIWIKSGQGNQGDIFAANDSGSGHPLEFYIEGGYPGRYDGGDATYTTAPLVADGQWHMMTYVRKDNTGYIYVDGVQAVEDSASFDLSTITRWSIGQEWDNANPSNFYVGMVDEARFYNASLTAEQVQELMRSDP